MRAGVCTCVCVCGLLGTWKGAVVLRQRGAGLVRKTGESVRWNKRKKKAKRVHRTRHEFGVAPVGISRFTCVFHLSSWGVALASSTYDPPSNGRASNDVTGFPRFPLVPSYRRGTTDVACILLFYLLPIVRPRMHMHCLSFPFALLSLSLSFFSFFFFFFFRTLTRYHAALRRSVATFPRVEGSFPPPSELANENTFFANHFVPFYLPCIPHPHRLLLLLLLFFIRLRLP